MGLMHSYLFHLQLRLSPFGFVCAPLWMCLPQLFGVDIRAHGVSIRNHALCVFFIWIVQLLFVCYFSLYLSLFEISAFHKIWYVFLFPRCFGPTNLSDIHMRSFNSIPVWLHYWFPSLNLCITALVFHKIKYFYIKKNMPSHNNKSIGATLSTHNEQC